MKSVLVAVCVSLALIAKVFAQDKCDAQIAAFRDCRAQLRQSTNNAFSTQKQQENSRLEKEQYFEQIQTCFTRYGCEFDPSAIAELKDYDTCTTQMRTSAKEFIQHCVRGKSGQNDFIMPLSRSAAKIQELGSHELASALQYCQIQSGVTRRDLLKCINKQEVTTTSPPPFFGWFKSAVDRAQGLLESATLFQGKSLNLETANELYSEFCKKQASCEAKVSENCNSAICSCIQSFNEHEDIELIFRGCLANEAEKQDKPLKIDVALVHNSIKTMQREMPQFCEGVSEDYSVSDDEQKANKLCNSNCIQDVLYGDKFKSTCQTSETTAAPAEATTTAPGIFSLFHKVVSASGVANPNTGSNLFGNLLSKSGFNFGG